ncbi:hypothetical protein V5O48_015559, partial [Marasmius crinis-equi]
PELIARFGIPPKHFHLELSPGCSLKDDIVHWAVLNTTGCIHQTAMTMRIDEAHAVYEEDNVHAEAQNMPLRVTGCCCPSCYGATVGDLSCSSLHRQYQTACLQTMEAFASDFCSTALRKVPGFTVAELNGIFGNVLDSLLLEHCAFGSELFCLCHKLFTSAQNVSHLLLHHKSNERRKKLMEWLEICPECYSREAEAIKAQMLSFFEAED